MDHPEYSDNYYKPYDENNYYNNDNFYGNESADNIMSEAYFPYNLLGITMCFYMGCYLYHYSNSRNRRRINEPLQKNQGTIQKIKKNSIDYEKIDDGLKVNRKCVICLEDYNQKDKIGILECRHVFHLNCIVEWVEKEISCPLCRSSTLI
tara:strand:+ start:466 stop:915 length:450 start_codon:yes stop_codon:yes gene_type:complete